MLWIHGPEEWEECLVSKDKLPERLDRLKVLPIILLHGVVFLLGYHPLFWIDAHETLEVLVPSMIPEVIVDKVLIVLIFLIFVFEIEVLNLGVSNLLLKH